MNFGEIRNKGILILGFGIEGQASYVAIRNEWPEQFILIADEKVYGDFEISDDLRAQIRQDTFARLYFGPSYLEGLAYADVLIKSPGIPPTHAALVMASSMCLPVTSHTELFFSQYALKNIIGVTGTKGKSTTTSLIHRILQTAGRNALLAGNIGQPPPLAGKKTNGKDVVVFELSSHQLAPLRSSPHIAVLLNLYPDHLDYYTSIAEYAAAKENITKYQTAEDFLVYNCDDKIAVEIANRSRAKLIPFSRTQHLTVGCYLSGDHFVFREKADDVSMVLPAMHGKLLGQFNFCNILAAVSVAAICGATSEQIVTGINNFEPLSHRIEPIGTYGGVEFYDDSIATIPEATIAALDALGNRVSTLIAGGFDRGSGISFELLVAYLEQSSVRTLILFPDTGVKIWERLVARAHSPLKIQAFHVDNMETAVKLAYQHTERGEICLLSPASASFGLFKNFKDRGLQFKNNVVDIGRSVEEFSVEIPHG